MPEQFDPSWEYYEPDQEVEEGLGLSGFRDTSFALYDDCFDRRHQRCGSPTGFHQTFFNPRYGGDPNRYSSHVGRERKSRGGSLDYHVKCMGCGDNFLPDRVGRRHCSSACYKRPGREKEFRTDTVTCRSCGVEFTLNRKGQSCCTPWCGGKLSDKVFLSRAENVASLPPGSTPCPECGRSVDPGKNLGRPKVFCGRSCLRRSVNRKYLQSKRVTRA